MPYSLAGTFDGLVEYLAQLRGLKPGTTWRDLHPEMPDHWIVGNPEPWTQEFAPYGPWDYQQLPAGAAVMVGYVDAGAGKKFEGLVNAVVVAGFKLYGAGNRGKLFATGNRIGRLLTSVSAHRQFRPTARHQSKPLFLSFCSSRQTAMLRATLAMSFTLFPACAHRTGSGAPFQMGAQGAIARARADSLRYPYTRADIDFMSGMIHHHAQAITISRWAVSHGADPAVQRLTARIINAQTDDITNMQHWLEDRNQPAPHVDSAGAVTVGGAHAMAGMSMPGMSMPGMDTPDMAMMPGMLSDVQMKALDAARGSEFDRLFLTDMIQHHRGAVQMVNTLFSFPGAGQDEAVFKFASDVEVDQSTEIRRMLSMMLEMGFAPPTQ